MLSASEIHERSDRDNLIEGFSKHCLAQCGYDLRLKQAYEITSESRLGVDSKKMPDIQGIKQDKIRLSSGDFILVETLEKVNMPTSLAAFILPRSSLFRCGVSLDTAVVDPGYQGTLTMGMGYSGPHSFTIERNARFAQIVFVRVEGDVVGYDGSYQGGKVV